VAVPREQFDSAVLAAGLRCRVRACGGRGMQREGGLVRMHEVEQRVADEGVRTAPEDFFAGFIDREKASLAVEDREHPAGVMKQLLEHGGIEVN
jgi:hypothetical protein